MRHRVITLALLLVATLSGCVVAPPMYRPAPSGIYLPAPRPEVISVSPGPGYLWIDGLWLGGDRRTWQPGRWEHRSFSHGGEPPHRSHERGQEHGRERGGWR